MLLTLRHTTPIYENQPSDAFVKHLRPHFGLEICTRGGKIVDLTDWIQRLSNIWAFGHSLDNSKGMI
jgi:hypothetical protein